MKVLRLAAAVLGAVCPLLLCAAAYASGVPRDPAATAFAPTACQHSDFRIVLDVGHTLAVPGAISARGIPEYAFNLQLGQEVRQALTAAGFDKTVLLITATAPPMGLFERAMHANRMAANLFISLHHDSVPVNLMETWEYGGKENHFSDRFTGYAIFVANDNASRAGSLMFGRLLGEALEARGLHYTPHYTLPLMGARRRVLLDPQAGVYRYNKLIVLHETHMPAVLLESGSIVNRQEELELANPEHRALIAAAITSAVEDFCAARAASAHEHVAKSPGAHRAVHPVAARLPWPFSIPHAAPTR